MKLFYADHFVLPLPPDHRFPMRKYSRLRERVQESALVPPESLLIPPPASDEQLLLAHHPDYVQAVATGTLTARQQRKIGFPWTPGMVERSRRSVGATIEAARYALAEGLAASLAGGTHHAFADSGGGYCVFNDVVVAARVWQKAGTIRRALVIDCDVHQGDGTAALCAHDPSIYTFSIHGEKNYPYHKPPSDLDLPLPDDSGDEVYLAALDYGLHHALEAAGADLAFYLAGADPYAGDRLGRMKLSKGGLLARDAMVLRECRARGLPVAILMAGGYAKEIEDIVDIHYQTLALAVDYWRAWPR
jgi:acetoin utilization deacetylase AcuC-like enzyme